jgi:predicted DNA-binding antitoxin AbrB/MazE fold protein
MTTTEQQLMTKEIEAIYEHGIIRPVKPLELPEGSRLDVIVMMHEKPRTNGNAASILAEIAALPLEGASDTFSGREHDSILYPKKPAA